MTAPRDWADDLADTLVADMANDLPVLVGPQVRALVASRLRLLKNEGEQEGLKRAQQILAAPPKVEPQTGSAS